jgi:predicted enzyme related to lactoylglutathione lyase
MSNPVVHFEISGSDAAQLQKFYGQMFDWKIDANNPMNYGMVKTGGGGINGGIAPAQQNQPASVTVYVEVPDLAAALKHAEGLGGKSNMPPMPVPNGPTIAMFADPEGNVIGLVQSGTM